MANAKMTVEFLPNGSQIVKFSSIEGVSPGRIRRAELQARREHVRLCALAAGEMRQKAKAKEVEETIAEATEAPVEEDAVPEDAPEEAAAPTVV